MPKISVGGHALEIQRIEGAGATLVFLHEGLGSIQQWRDFPRQIAEATGCHALVYDRHGYGQSAVLKEKRVGLHFMHDAALKELPALLKKLKIENPILVGHSDGGSIALIHAGKFPTRGVVTMAAHVFVEDFGLKSIEEINRTFETSGLRERLGKYHKDPAKTFHLWADAWLDAEFSKWNIEEYLPGIRCPVLAMQGKADEYGTMAQLEAIKRQVSGPCELMKLRDCGHAPFRDRPRKVLEAIAKFVRKTLATDA
jgi:pimeloyl-ACP methyl ester carboxylesterase